MPGADGYRAGSAYIAVSPNFRGFQLAAARQAQKLRPIKVPVEYDTSREPTFKPTKPVKVPVTFDVKGGSFQQKLQAQVRAASAALGDIEIGVAATEAEQKIRDLKAELAALAGKRIGVDIDAREALNKITELQAELTVLGERSPNIDVQADTAAATGHLAEVLAMADAVGARSPTIDVDADTGAATGKLAAIAAFASGLSLAHPIITVGIALAPLMAPLLAGLAGGAMGLAGIGTGLLGGAAAGALGAVVLKQAIDGQKKLTQATKARKTAVQGVASAEHSLASAEASANTAQINATRAVTDAEHGVADARRNGARSIQAAEQSLADARRSGTQAITAAEQGLADARRNGARAIASAEQALGDARRSAARADAQAAEQVAAAQQQVAAANKNVRQSEAALHQARKQAIRDMADLRAQVHADRLEVRAAQFDAEDAQAKLADIETNVFASSDDIARARLAAAQAEQKVADARQKSAQDAADLSKAEKTHGDSLAGVQAALQQLQDARQAQAQAVKQLAAAQKAAAQTRADGARSIARAEQNLAQTRADAARSVGQAEQNLAQTRQDAARSVSRAEQNLAQTRQDAARSVSRAEQNLARARADGARAVAQAQAQVAEAHRRVAAAEDKLTAADKARAAALAAITPAQHRMLVELTQLKKAWAGFLGMIGKPLAGAGIAGMKAVEKILPGLAAFLKPVYRALRDVFTMLGSDLGSKGAKQTARIFGVFSGHIIRDAYKGTKFFVEGLVDLLQAFMPFSRDMSKGIVDLMKKFRDWAAGLAKSKGFKDFIGYVRENGPLFLSVLGGIAKIVGKLIIGMAPLGHFMLVAANGVGKFLGKLNPDVLLGIVGAIAGLVAILGGGPISLVVAIVAVASIVARHWKTIGKALAEPAISAKNDIVHVWHDITGAFSKAWTWVSTGWSKKWAKTKTFLLGPVNDAKNGITSAWNWIRARFTDAWNWLSTGWGHRWAKIEGILLGPLRDAKNAIADLFGPGGPIRNAFSNGVDAIGRIWDNMKALAAKPVNFVIGTVWNNGLRKIINAIPGVGDLKPVPLVNWGGGGGSAGQSFNNGGAGGHHLATGGVLPGWTPGRDVYTFVSPKGGTLHLAGGEAIMVPEWTRAMGGPLAVDRMNKAARTGRLRQLGDVGAFAGGGTLSAAAIEKAQRFAQAQVGKPYVWGGVGPGGYDCSGFMSAITNVLRGVYPYSRVGSTATFPWPGFVPGPGQFTIGSANPFPGSSVGHMAGTLGGMGVESYGSHGPSTSHRNAYSPGFSTHAHLGARGSAAITSHGGAASAFAGAIATIKDIFGDAKKWFGELAAMGGWGGLIKKIVPALAGEIRGWVNGKIPGPGPIPSVFDDGGQLHQGLTLAYHGARKPDKVLTDSQFSDLHRLAVSRNAGMPAKFDLYDSNNQLIGRMAGIARSAVNGRADFDDSLAGAGMGGR